MGDIKDDSNEVLTKLLTVGYDVLGNIIFGTNYNISEYNVEWLKEWLDIELSGL
jgi:hypothetical protein